MKRQLINSLFFAALVFAGCKKDDGRYPSSIALQRVPYVNVTVDASGSQAIDLLNLASFQGKYNLSLLYPDDVKPSKVDVVIRKNGSNASTKVLQSSVGSFPSSFTVTSAQLASLFGAPVALGDNYDIGTDIYTAEGAKYEAFPTATGATAYGGTGQANQPGFTPTARFSAICAYDPNIYQGNFVVVTDAWADFSPGDVIVLTKISNNSFSFLDPFARDPLPIIVTINTGNNAATVAKQVIGSSWTYGAASAYPQPTVSAAGTVAPCDKTITLNVQYGVSGISGGVYGGGPYALVLRKQ